MDPNIQQCSFQNLLNSQQPNTQWNESVSASVPCEPYQSVSASDASVFCSQWNEDGNEDAEALKLDDQTAQSSSSVQVNHGEEAMARPVGVKAAKAKGKKPVSKQATLEEEEKDRKEFQSIREIRQADFALKATLNKQKLLESLLAKTEPLTELEITLKNKLINDLLTT
ncbi:hypothetical protein Bca52824_032863 [Brassica carinata]|uniref:No apical meristem-associated C-terminal domain-containing protein n=1 Tax=Brassica carinata TaxID=52824 RepID=A0A8X7SDW7_BRACI|nr:hypothetical protein Bca52824_032863 [Brassica carinata]